MGKDNQNTFVLITIVAIVAIVALVVLILGAGAKAHYKPTYVPVAQDTTGQASEAVEEVTGNFAVGSTKFYIFAGSSAGGINTQITDSIKRWNRGITWNTRKFGTNWVNDWNRYKFGSKDFVVFVDSNNKDVNKRRVVIFYPSSWRSTDTNFKEIVTPIQHVVEGSSVPVTYAPISNWNNYI